MGRPPKKGLLYFSKDIDFYEDFKIIDLMECHGPLGAVVYDVLLCMIYKEGYYIECDLESLARKVVRTIGGRWANKGIVLQVIRFCAESDLFCEDLLMQGVITSVGIQRRYASVTVRSKAHKGKYWLLEPEDESVENDEKDASKKIEGAQALFPKPFKSVSAEKTGVFAVKTPIKTADSTQKKRKENKRKEKEREIAPAPEKNEELSTESDELSTGTPKERFSSYSEYMRSYSEYMDSPEYNELKKAHGKFDNVYLTEKELDTLASEYPHEFDEMIDRLSAYIKSSGRYYDNHYATLILWAERDAAKWGGK